jgi:hypothetical protein
MSKTKYNVRLLVVTQADNDLIRAKTKVGDKELSADGPDEATAIDRLKSEIDRYLRRQAFRAQYPKNVEVSL